MKNLLFAGLLSAVILGLAFNIEGNAPANHSSETPTMEKSGKNLRHVVLFKFKSTSSEADIETVRKAFSALPKKIKEIKDYEWGINNSPEGLDKGFTHCFFVTFKSEEDRAVYLPHPAHKAFVDVLKPHLEDVLVIDYWASEE